MSPTVLIANRGVIARRILRTCQKLGWPGVVVYSEADAGTLPVREASQSCLLGPSPASASYLDAAKLLHVAREYGAEIVHPGYGFLSENADFCEACEAEEIAFAGPTPEQMRLFGLKNTARDAARGCGIPLLPGTDLLETVAEATAAAEGIHYPVMLKSTAGGGGIGMQICRDAFELREAYERVRRLGEANFRHGGVFLEKFVERARHIEVQIFGDGAGRVLAFGERDCSAQRRNQKVIEETPAPDLPDAVREALREAAVRLGKSVSYRGAGTVEFLYDSDTRGFYFLEVNTRLQVEHGVTEQVFGVDLVEGMLRLAAGDLSFWDDWEARATAGPTGASIQARIYAEIPAKNFQPSTGLVTRAVFPETLRIETWIDSGTEVTACYDPMLAKLIATAPTRTEALDQLAAGLEKTHLDGVETNRDHLLAILKTPEFRRGGISTNFLGKLTFEPNLVEVLDGGIETLAVDWPGRTGYWEVGVPPSGPFDDRSFRQANLALGNPEGAPGLEMTVRGPTLKFLRTAWCCLGGADMRTTLEDRPVARGIPFLVEKGQTLRVGEVAGAGLRACLAFRGGLDLPEYLGSRTTFRLGQFGGHGGRALRAGDFLRLFETASEKPEESREFESESWGNEWTLGVSYGPHGAPDFFTPEDMEMFFSTAWEVHYNSARTGVRLVGPKPKWARSDGGEAGLHPSNIHDNAYQVGAVDFTGDMPIILGPDGPSLGGFVCPATVLSNELWKVGQLRPGDRVRFHPVALPTTFTPSQEGIHSFPFILESPVVHEEGDVVYRRQGDSGVLVEFGPLVLDLTLRFRVQALYEALRANPLPGLLDLTPGIRSLQVRHDPALLPSGPLLTHLREVVSTLPMTDELAVPTRTIHLPLSWDDPATRLAIEKYMQSVRSDAPWCPSNLEFIRRINGLESIEEVRRIVFEASYLVLGLGDVYLGAPVATPLDPRHRLVTTKYNPARTWTPENAVGIGGAYLCIYGMEGPGGYQFVGRTVPVWNRFRTTRSFEPGRPWLLRFFDQIRFYPVEAGELLDLRADLLTGKFEPRIEQGEFRLADYEKFLSEESDSIASFRAKQREAFDAERQRWKSAGQDLLDVVEPVPEPVHAEIPEGCFPVNSPAAGSLWKWLVTPGSRVSKDSPVAILESMKMEIPCLAPEEGTVREILVAEGRPVSPGQSLLLLEP